MVVSRRGSVFRRRPSKGESRGAVSLLMVVSRRGPVFRRRPSKEESRGAVCLLMVVSRRGSIFRPTVVLGRCCFTFDGRLTPRLRIPATTIKGRIARRRFTFDGRLTPRLRIPATTIKGRIARRRLSFDGRLATRLHIPTDSRPRTMLFHFRWSSHAAAPYSGDDHQRENRAAPFHF